MTTKGTFDYLNKYQFVVLTTYRKDGTAVPTTVWFANDGGKVYITTQKSAGKFKRVRNNGRVELVPSDRVGTLLGEEAVEGKAQAVPDSEHNHAYTVLKQKYGEQFDRIAGAQNVERVYIVVEPVAIV